MKRIFALILACFSLHSFAEEVSGLYTGLVPVVDQSAESRDLALTQALTQVLVKLTGNSKITQSTKLQPFLTNPNAFVSGIGFRTIPSVTDEGQTGMEVSFDRQALDQVIRQAQLPVLPSNRPKLLVWIIRDDAVFGRDFEGLESNSIKKRPRLRRRGRRRSAPPRTGTGRSRRWSSSSRGCRCRNASASPRETPWTRGTARRTRRRLRTD